MNVVRRSATALAVTAVIGAAAAPAAYAASPAPSLPSGLYGTGDPTYDGVWRQSLALLAQDTAGVRPAAAAVDWLTGQQCADGSFAPYRADPAKACDAKTPVDTNMTSAAVQALAALGGHEAATGKAVAWLKSVQNKDGGWGYTAGGPSDANSTSLAVGALAAAGERPADVVKGGRSPYDALLALAVPCDAAEGAGAFAYQPGDKGALAANADATAAAVLAALGKGLTAEAATAGAAPSCTGGGDPTPEQAAANGAAYLAGALAGDGHLMSALAGAEDRPDYGNTADAVVALAAQGGARQAAEPLKWLERNALTWARQTGPAAYAQLILAAHAAHADPRDFGGTDLVQRLNATGPAPQDATPAAGPDREAASESESESESESDDGFGVWWYVGVCLVAGVGIGFLLSGRNRGRQP
ncbi:prenyltransferase/squalene oxidase repeat-containing protein [Streptomyces cinereospinus]|uniref:Prenyltransferase/squalene oxidase repeat-containing protein n=1 Tax=Streptomyces cinereospinus TaxID=285561 RepID=A0ABV5MXK2_9ACTN